MSMMVSEVFISQFVAYLLGTYVFCPLLIHFFPAIKNSKLIHPVLVGVIAYLFYGQWDYMALPIWFCTLQFMVDFIFRKVRKDGSIFWIIELVLRVAGMVCLPLVFPAGISTCIGLFGVEYFGVLTLISGWIFVGCWCGDLIGMFLKQFEMKDSTGIKEGGRLIGLLERSMVYLLMLLNAPTGIGFLITAKTIFRFGEINKQGENRKQVEYILIGTLLSFFLGALVSVLAMYFSLQFFPGWQFKLLK